MIALALRHANNVRVTRWSRGHGAAIALLRGAGVRAHHGCSDRQDRCSRGSMMAQHNEVEFEKELCQHLADNGWLSSPTDAGYDKARALFPEDVVGVAGGHPAEGAGEGGQADRSSRAASEGPRPATGSAGEGPRGAPVGAGRNAAGTAQGLPARFGIAEDVPVPAGGQPQRDDPAAERPGPPAGHTAGALLAGEPAKLNRLGVLRQRHPGGHRRVRTRPTQGSIEGNSIRRKCRTAAPR